LRVLQRSEIITVTQALAKALGRPTTPEDTLGVLRDDVKLSDSEIARGLGVSSRTVKRWRGGSAISTESQERLFDLAKIVATLAVDLPPANVRAWFFHRNRFLEDERPIDVIAAEGFEGVQPALGAIRDSVYA
jgi:putative toxin-antitoxin system antitoxin component (TIGR02293 family)